MNTIIRKIRPEEYSLLREFLYQAIYLPVGVDPPPRSVVDLPELQVYIADFGTRPGDHGLVAEVEKKVIGAAWCRIMADYRAGGRGGRLHYQAILSGGPPGQSERPAPAGHT